MGMLVEHERIYTGPSGETTDALLVREGKVEAVGEEAKRRASDDESRVRPSGACVMPGLTDAHCHLWGVGRRLGTVDLAGSESPDEVYERLRSGGVDGDETAGAAEWLLGRGWDEHAWSSDEKQDFGRERLDDLFPERPVCLHRVDSHAVVCNSEALRRGDLIGRGVRLSELDEQVAEAGGRLGKTEDGELNGLLVDAGMRPVLEAIPEPTREEDEQLMRQAADDLVAMGVTSAHLARVEVDRVEMLEELEDDGELPMRMYALVDGMDSDLPSVLKRGPQHDSDARLSVAGIKMFADGALGSRGALLIDGYADGSEGLEDVGPDELCTNSVSWMGNGWQVAVHAIGDLANQRVLDAYGLVPETVRDEVRPRLEHAQMLTDDDVHRAGELDVIASIQPIHMRSDATWASELLTDEQCRRLFRWRELGEVTTLAAGSDFPIEDSNPWHGMATAMTRRAANGGEFFAEQALDRRAAVAAYTTGASYAAHWEESLGRLKPGYRADIVAVDIDPFEDSPDAIWGAGVDEVWIDGEPQLNGVDER